jgi:methylated-DNA-[protein]-cysteine S-methyltransferase
MAPSRRPGRSALAARELFVVYQPIVPLAPEGTPFQRAVWAMLAEIPRGATWSYGQLAKAYLS